VPLDVETGEIYRRVKIALLTGWTMDYIEGLGMVDSEAILQVYEAENYVEVKRGG